MPGTTPTAPPPSTISPPGKRALSRARESPRERADGPSQRDGNERGIGREPHAAPLGACTSHCSRPCPAAAPLPSLTTNGPASSKRRIAGDDDAVRRVFAAAARWANQLIHQRFWLLDAEAEIVTLLWDTLHARPASSDDWRTLVRRRLTRRQYRPSPEVATPREILEDTVPGGEFEARVLDQLDARRTLRTLGPDAGRDGPVSRRGVGRPAAGPCCGALRPPVPVPAPPSRRMNRRRRTAALVVTAAVLAACDSPDRAATTMPSSTTAPPPTTPPASPPSVPGPAPADDGGAASPGAWSTRTSRSTPASSPPPRRSSARCSSPVTSRCRPRPPPRCATPAARPST